MKKLILPVYARVWVGGFPSLTGNMSFVYLQPMLWEYEIKYFTPSFQFEIQNSVAFLGWKLKSVYKRMFLCKCPLYDFFWPFFCHMYDQNWGSDGHFEVLNRSYLWLVEKLWHKTQIFPFLFFFVILYKNRRLHNFCFLHFCVFCHNLCAN